MAFFAFDFRLVKTDHEFKGRSKSPITTSRPVNLSLSVRPASLK